MSRANVNAVIGKRALDGRPHVVIDLMSPTLFTPRLEMSQVPRINPRVRLDPPSMDVVCRPAKVPERDERTLSDAKDVIKGWLGIPGQGAVNKQWTWPPENVVGAFLYVAWYLTDPNKWNGTGGGARRPRKPKKRVEKHPAGHCMPCCFLKPKQRTGKCAASPGRAVKKGTTKASAHP